MQSRGLEVFRLLLKILISLSFYYQENEQDGNAVVSEPHTTTNRLVASYYIRIIFVL